MDMAVEAVEEEARSILSTPGPPDAASLESTPARWASRRRSSAWYATSPALLAGTPVAAARDDEVGAEDAQEDEQQEQQDDDEEDDEEGGGQKALARAESLAALEMRIARVKQSLTRLATPPSGDERMTTAPRGPGRNEIAPPGSDSELEVASEVGSSVAEGGVTEGPMARSPAPVDVQQRIEMASPMWGSLESAMTQPTRHAAQTRGRTRVTTPETAAAGEHGSE